MSIFFDAIQYEHIKLLHQALHMHKQGGYALLMFTHTCMSSCIVCESKVALHKTGSGQNSNTTAAFFVLCKDLPYAYVHDLKSVIDARRNILQSDGYMFFILRLLDHQKRHYSNNV